MLQLFGNKTKLSLPSYQSKPTKIVSTNKKTKVLIRFFVYLTNE
jgi:hypothetical protein